LHVGALVRDWALDARPDIIILAPDLPDITGIEACRQAHNDIRIGHHIPMILVTPEPPTPEQRVDALSAGAWDFLRYPGDPAEVTLKLEAYVQAKRNLDLALAEGLVDPTTGLHSRMGLARRARELGALMSRTHGAMSCIVFAIEPADVVGKLPRIAEHATRASDVVGALNQHMFAVLAPGTEQAGVVQLARRVSGALLDWFGADITGANASIRAGYESVGNLKYSPIDPVELLARATAAVRDGALEPGLPWLRRYFTIEDSGPERQPRFSPARGVPA